MTAAPSQSLDRARVVAAVCETFFHRMPEPHDFEFHLTSLAHVSDSEFVAEMLHRLEAAEEFRAHLVRRIAIVPESVRNAQVLGLGTHCLTAEVLRSLELRQFALPFDWIFSSPKAIRHAVLDDFATFLDPGQYRPPPDDGFENPHFPRIDNQFYRSEFAIRGMFNHHDPRDEAHHAYFRRCVSRFRDLQQGGVDDRVFLVIHQESARAPVALSDYLAVADVLPAPRLVAVVVRYGGGLLPKASLELDDDRCRVSVMSSRSRLRGIFFDEPLDHVALNQIVLDELAFALGEAS